MSELSLVMQELCRAAALATYFNGLKGTQPVLCPFCCKSEFNCKFNKVSLRVEILLGLVSFCVDFYIVVQNLLFHSKEIIL